MQEFIDSLDKDYLLDDYIFKGDLIVFKIASRKPELVCPYCGQASSKVHSSYEREIQDLPLQNHKVILLVKTRKFFCMNEECNKRTFSERHSFVDVSGKKTNRLVNNILMKSTQLSSMKASRILQQENIDICKSSICLLLKKNATHCG